MKFWDSSALMPLLTLEPASARVEAILWRDPGMVIWWGAAVECASALARLHRNGELPASSMRRACAVLAALQARALEVEPLAEIRERARHLLAVHNLRAADSLQLAAALAWCGDRPRGAGFLCLDERLRGAAVLEGFTVMPYAEEVHEAELEASAARQPT